MKKMPFCSVVVVARMALGTIAVALLVSGCRPPPVCHPWNAFSIGKAQALRGKAIQYPYSDVCTDDEDWEKFQTNLQRGYAVGTAELCADERLHQLGVEQGREGRLPEVPDELSLCGESGATAFRSGHGRGLAEFCAPATVEGLGYAVGSKGDSRDYDPTQYANCASDGDRLQSSYRSGHLRGVHDFCAAPDMETKGYEDGANYKLSKASSLVDEYHLCGEPAVVALQRRYQQGFERGFESYCQPEKHVTAIDELALKYEEPHHKRSSYSRCLTKQANTWDRYDRFYRQRRRALVREHCSYNRGRDDAIEAAQKSAVLDGTMPTFCDAESFEVYLRGLERGWEIGKHTVCRLDEADQVGEQSAFSEQRRNLTPPRHCVAELASTYRARYLEGYRRARARMRESGDSVQRVVRLHNATWHVAYFAVGVSRWDQWRATGWYRLEPGRQRDIVVLADDHPDVYCHAKSNGRAWGRKDAQLCVRDDAEFRDLSGTSCDLGLDPKEAFVPAWQATRLDDGSYYCAAR